MQPFQSLKTQNGVHFYNLCSLIRLNFNNQHKPGFQKKNHYANTKLEVRKIPRDLNNITKLNEHFSKFGTIVNIQVRILLNAVHSPVLAHFMTCLFAMCVRMNVHGCTYDSLNCILSVLLCSLLF